MPDAGIVLDDAVIVECSRCGAVSAVPAAHDVTNKIAEIATLRGALDFVREVTCRNCGAVIEVRPNTT